MNDLLTKEGTKDMQEQSFIEQILRVNPDVIYSSPSLRTTETAKEVAEIMKTYRNKKVKIKIEERLRSGEGKDTIGAYKKLIKK